MSDPNSANPLFPNPTVMPDNYPRKDKLKSFNKLETPYGKNELEGHKPYYQQQSDRKNADRYGMKKKK